MAPPHDFIDHSHSSRALGWIAASLSSAGLQIGVLHNQYRSVIIQIAFSNYQINYIPACVTTARGLRVKTIFKGMHLTLEHFQHS